MSSEIINYLRKVNTQQGIIDKLITALHEQNPQIKGDPKTVKKIITGNKRKKTSTLIVGQQTLVKAHTKRREIIQFARKPPIPVKSYPLVHTITGTPTYIEDGHKLAGGALFNGSSYITINDDDSLDVTTDIVIAFYIKPKASAGDGIIVEKSGAYSVRIIDTNKIQFKINAKTPITYTYTADIDSWIHVICKYNSASGGQQIYINNSLQSSDSETGVISTNTNTLQIGGNGTNNLPNGTQLSWLHLNSNNVNSTWRTNLFTNKILDTSDGNNEITTIPFTGDWNPEPDATAGLCQTD